MLKRLNLGKTCKKMYFFMKKCYNFYIFSKYIAEKIIIGV